MFLDSGWFLFQIYFQNMGDFVNIRCFKLQLAFFHMWKHWFTFSTVVWCYVVSTDIILNSCKGSLLTSTWLPNLKVQNKWWSFCDVILLQWISKYFWPIKVLKIFEFRGKYLSCNMFNYMGTILFKAKPWNKFVIVGIIIKGV